MKAHLDGRHCVTAGVLPLLLRLCSVGMDLQLRHLRAFVAVASEGSFTAAARQLLITQPALTRTIQQLEAHLEVQLFERNTRSLNLTAPGEEFLARVGPILRDLDVAVAQARSERVLRVGFEWALPDPWAAELVEAFEAATGARVNMTRHDGAITSLLDNDIDVALTRQRVEHLEQVVAIPLFDEERVAAVSARSSLAHQDQLAFNELAHMPLVVNTVSGATWPELWPPDHRPQEVRECSNYDEWLALIAADQGVGTTPLSSSRTHDHAGVRYLRLTGAPRVHLHLVLRTGNANPLVRRFVEAARK
jgi:DNA-binding transcriptional LysR family regulator